MLMTSVREVHPHRASLQKMRGTIVRRPHGAKDKFYRRTKRNTSEAISYDAIVTNSLPSSHRVAFRRGADADFFEAKPR